MTIKLAERLTEIKLGVVRVKKAPKPKKIKTAEEWIKYWGGK